MQKSQPELEAAIAAKSAEMEACKRRPYRNRDEYISILNDHQRLAAERRVLKDALNALLPKPPAPVAVVASKPVPKIPRPLTDFEKKISTTLAPFQAKTGALSGGA